MDIWTTLGIAVALAMDAFAVSVVAGLTLAPATFRQTFRVSFHFGLFQFLMPIAGWNVGKAAADYIKSYDHWVALILLWYIGINMLINAFKGEPVSEKVDPSRGLSLILLSFATSIDALIVGAGMALLGVSVIKPAILIGLVTGTLCIAGMTCAGRCSKNISQYSQVFGGLVLMAVGVHILLSHLID